MSDLDAAIEIIEDLVGLSALRDMAERPGVIDSGCITAIADGMRFLAKHGRMEIVSQISPRNIQAKWVRG